MSNYQRVKLYDVANGEGIRTTIFFCGCNLHCHNCFNYSIWDFGAGQPFTRESYIKEIRDTMNIHVDGLSILGGEPLDEKNIYTVAQLIMWFRNDFQDTKNIWLWSGYTPEELVKALNNKENVGYSQLLEYILDEVQVIILGRYEEEKKDASLLWRGSSNQILLKLEKGKESLLEYYDKNHRL